MKAKSNHVIQNAFIFPFICHGWHYGKHNSMFAVRCTIMNKHTNSIGKQRLITQFPSLYFMKTGKRMYKTHTQWKIRKCVSSSMKEHQQKQQQKQQHRQQQQENSGFECALFPSTRHHNDVEECVYLTAIFREISYFFFFSLLTVPFFLVRSLSVVRNDFLCLFSVKHNCVCMCAMYFDYELWCLKKNPIPLVNRCSSFFVIRSLYVVYIFTRSDSRSHRRLAYHFSIQTLW